jgi:hypothetical protein
MKNTFLTFVGILVLGMLFADETNTQDTNDMHRAAYEARRDMAR